MQDPFRGRAPSPLGYDTGDTSYHGAGGVGAGGAGGAYGRPAELQGGAGAGDPFRDGLALSHDHGGYAGGGGSRLDFPEGNYGR